MLFCESMCIGFPNTCNSFSTSYPHGEFLAFQFTQGVILGYCFGIPTGLSQCQSQDTQVAISLQRQVNCFLGLGWIRTPLSQIIWLITWLITSALCMIQNKNWSAACHSLLKQINTHSARIVLFHILSSLCIRSAKLITMWSATKPWYHAAGLSTVRACVQRKSDDIQQGTHAPDDTQMGRPSILPRCQELPFSLWRRCFRSCS